MNRQLELKEKGITGLCVFPGTIVYQSIRYFSYVCNDVPVIIPSCVMDDGMRYKAEEGELERYSYRELTMSAFTPHQGYTFPKSCFTCSIFRS